MEVTQTDKAITLDCGCNVDIIITAYSVSNLAVQSTLSLCPLHRAADDLLEALLDQTCEGCGIRFDTPSDFPCKSCEQARTAIDKAKEPITS